MSIAHHLDDATLMSCAAGALPPALAVVAASHISVCPHCRDGLAVAERFGGALLAELAPVPITTEPVLPHEDGAPAARGRPARPTAPDVPPPLGHLLAAPLDALRWRPLSIGIWQHRVPIGASGAEVRLIKASPGSSLPGHGHNGAELTLVLRGAFHDEVGRFAVGDIADLDETVDHTPVADALQGCICVLASERPARFHGLLARLLQPFIGM